LLVSVAWSISIGSPVFLIVILGGLDASGAPTPRLSSGFPLSSSFSYGKSCYSINTITRLILEQRVSNSIIHTTPELGLLWRFHQQKAKVRKSHSIILHNGYRQFTVIDNSVVLIIFKFSSKSVARP
jgi:glycosidase